MKQAIFYTHGMWEPIGSKVREQLLKCNIPIVSCSLEPLDFGQNVVLNLEPGILTMFKQILAALKASTADTIFFCEHDVLYHPSHFDFELPSRDKFYYNVNVWRWYYPTMRAVTWNTVRSLSGMCCDRELAIKHYEERVKFVEKNGWRTIYGYEPGTKKIRQGGITDDNFEDWKSEYPLIDIRHFGTITPRKCHTTSFSNKEYIDSFVKIRLDEVPGWDYKHLQTICPTT